MAATESPGSPGKRAADAKREPNSVLRFFKILGPGLITGAADDDPTAIATYSVAGATLGYSMLWTALFTFPMLAAMQFMSAKVGLVTRTGIAGVLLQRYSRKVVYPALLSLIIANTINIGAAIAAIAAGINLIVPIPIGLMIAPVTLIIIALLVLGSFRLIDNVFKLIALVLLTYVGASFFTRPDLTAVLSWFDRIRSG